MLDVKAKMHQLRFRLGITPLPQPRPLRGPISKGKGKGKEEGGEYLISAGGIKGLHYSHVISSIPCD